MTRAARAAAERRVGDAVARFGGLPDRAGSDEIVAVFGLPVLSGNEAERAVRAALEIVAPAPAASGNPRLAVAIARGLVLPAGSERPFPLAGSPLPQAQALARSIPAGTVVVSAEVALQVSDRFELEAGGDAESPGARRICGARAAHDWPTAAPLVGRRPELAMLATFLDRVVAARRGRAVVVRGEPGIGKSFLLAALRGSRASRRHRGARDQHTRLWPGRQRTADARIGSAVPRAACRRCRGRTTVRDRACRVGGLVVAARRICGGRPPRPSAIARSGVGALGDG